MFAERFNMAIYILIYILFIYENIQPDAFVSEWSKEVDLRPTVFARMGSNPIECKSFFLRLFYQYANIFIDYISKISTCCIRVRVV